MTKKAQKYYAEKEKINAKLSELQARNKELDRLITEAENTEILALMRSEKINLSELNAFMKAFREKDGAPFSFPEQGEADIPKQEETENDE